MTEEQLLEVISDEEATGGDADEEVFVADNDTGDLPDDKADELVDDKLEDGEIVSEDDDGRLTYGRDFLLSLQFLEQCKQRPPNLMNAEYIRKVYIIL